MNEEDSDLEPVPPSLTFIFLLSNVNFYGPGRTCARSQLLELILRISRHNRCQDRLLLQRIVLANIFSILRLSHLVQRDSGIIIAVESGILISHHI
jgi:hypothetical protein